MLNLDSVFPMRNNLYLIPYWIVDALHRHQMKIADVLNFTKLRPIFSLNDLASVQQLQSYGEELIGTRDVISGSILYEWYSSSTTNEELKKTIESVELLAKDPSLIEGLRFRFEPDSTTRDRTNLFEVIALDTKAIAVVLYPGVFSSELYDRQFQITRALLKQLYVYEHPTVVAGTPLYRRYLELLSVRKP